MYDAAVSREELLVPKLIPGIEVTPFDSASPDVTYLLTHPNGSRWEISELLHQIISAIDGKRDHGEIAGRVNLSGVEPVTTEEVHEVLTGLLKDIRVVEDEREPFALVPETYTAPRKSSTNLLVRIPLISPRMLRPWTAVLQYLFAKPVGIAIGSAALFIHIAWYALHPDALSPALLTLSSGDWVWMTFAIYLSYIVHEFGHAAACRRMGCAHGGIGFGLYLIFPRLYADVTDAWRLPRQRRAVVDAGGIYFQAVFAAGLMVAHFLTGQQFYLVAAVLVDFSCLHSLSPFVKLDGYWILSDLLGVANLDQKAKELARFRSRMESNLSRKTALVIYLYVGLSTLFIAFILFRMARYLPTLVFNQYPRIVQRFWYVLHRSWLTGRYLSAGIALIRLVAPTAMIAGIVLLLTKYLMRAVRLARQLARRFQTS